jgi:hypothetical protein
MGKKDVTLVWRDYMLFEDDFVPCALVMRRGKRWLWWGRGDDGVFRSPASSPIPAGDCATETEAKEACEQAALRRLK